MLKEYHVGLGIITKLILFDLFSSCWYPLYVDDVAVIRKNAVLFRWVPIVTNYLGLKKDYEVTLFFVFCEVGKGEGAKAGYELPASRTLNSQLSPAVVPTSVCSREVCYIYAHFFSYCTGFLPPWGSH